MGNISGGHQAHIGSHRCNCVKFFSSGGAKGSELTRSEMKKLIARRTNDSPKSQYSAEEAAVVEERLKALGYIE
jgi:hypothetical protein